MNIQARVFNFLLNNSNNKYTSKGISEKIPMDLKKVQGALHRLGKNHWIDKEWSSFLGKWFYSVSEKEAVL